jgi:hypothetical protein
MNYTVRKAFRVRSRVMGSLPGSVTELQGSESEHSQFARETMSTNKLVCQLCAEFIPAMLATEQNHRLTVGNRALCTRQGLLQGVVC